MSVNLVVKRRLDFIPDDEAGAYAVAEFLAGKPVSKIAAELDLTPTRAAYGLRQVAVSAGQVPAGAKGRAWAACIDEVSGGRIKVA